MSQQPPATIQAHFSRLTAPRVDRTKLHPLINMIMIAICAVICGAETWGAIENDGKAKREWLGHFLDLRNGIPSHDTFARVLAR